MIVKIPHAHSDKMIELDIYKEYKLIWDFGPTLLIIFQEGINLKCRNGFDLRNWNSTNLSLKEVEQLIENAEFEMKFKGLINE